MNDIASIRFPATQWTGLIEKCRSGDERAKSEALENLCRGYWHPLFAFAYRSGMSRHDAEDLTQGFMHYALEKDLFGTADRELGKLRTFLLLVFKRYIKDAREKEHAKKRGGNILIVEIDREDAGFSGSQIAHPAEPDLWFNRVWAHSLIETSMEELGSIERREGRGEAFGVLAPFIDPTSLSNRHYHEATARLGSNPDAVRKAVSRLRIRFHEILRKQVALTLHDPSPANIDAELAALRQTLEG